MDFDEPLGKVDYWAELEKQVIDKKQKEYNNLKQNKHLENEIVWNDLNNMTDSVKSEVEKKEILKCEFGWNKTMIQNNKLTKKIDGLNQTAPNFFPFGKGEKIMNLFGKVEKINIMPIDTDIIDFNQVRKDHFVNGSSKLTPCYEHEAVIPDIKQIRQNEIDFKRDTVIRHAEDRFNQKLKDNSN